MAFKKKMNCTVPFLSQKSLAVTSLNIKDLETHNIRGVSDYFAK
jgi:hypothetical protein